MSCSLCSYWHTLANTRTSGRDSKLLRGRGRSVDPASILKRVRSTDSAIGITTKGIFFTLSNPSRMRVTLTTLHPSTCHRKLDTGQESPCGMLVESTNLSMVLDNVLTLHAASGSHHRRSSPSAEYVGRPSTAARSVRVERGGSGIAFGGCYLLYG